MLRRALAAICFTLPCSIAFVAAQAQTAGPAVAPNVVPAGVTRVASVEGITEYALPNGLQVLLVPEASKPTTTVNLTIHAGSRQENTGETGMAHLLEHMVFKGTPTTADPKAEFSRRGLRFNGSTTQDRTNYFASFAANDDNLRWYTGWLADAMVNSFIARKDLDSEMTVVRNEMESGENNGFSITLQRMFAASHQWHAYGKAVIGARSDVENVDIARLQAFYRTYYQPDNATLIVSGKFDEASTLKLIVDTFGRIAKPTRTLPVFYTLDPVQDGERSVTVRRVGGNPLLGAMYNTVPASHPDAAALSVLALVLGDTPSGRLHKALVEQNLAAAAYGFGWSLHDPGAIIFAAVLGPDQDMSKARETLLATIEGIAARPITDEEFKRAQTAWLKSWELGFTDAERIGLALSESIAIGDWRFYFLQRDRIKALRREDVQRVAVERLVPDNRTLGLYIPTDKPVRAPAPELADVGTQIKTFKPVTTGASVEAFDATPTNIEAHVKRGRLANGLQYALLEKPTRGELVNATLDLQFGDETTLRDRSTAAEFANNLLLAGTDKLKRAQIRDRLDELKARVSIGGGATGLSVHLTTVRANLPAVLDLVADVLRNSTFPEDQIEEMRRSALAGIESSRKEPGAIVSNALSRYGNPYPKGHVLYAETFDESIDSIKRVSASQIREFHRDFFGFASGQFAAVGDFDGPTLLAQIERLFGSWAAKTPYHRVPNPYIVTRPDTLSFETPDKANAVFNAELDLPISDRDPDYPALMLANRLLGGGSSSRLWRRIRETEGLSYGVGSGITWSFHEQNSGWQSWAIFAPQNRERVLAAWHEEIDRVLKTGFTADEVKEGISGLLEERQLSRAQDAGLASTLTTLLEQGRTLNSQQKTDDALRGLTVEEVNAALRKYLDPKHIVIGVAGDFAKTAGK